MSNSQYWTLLTRAGREKVLAAIAGDHSIKISEFAVGDGQISHTSNDLINRQYRSHTSALKQLTHNNALIEVVGIVPATEGGFYVREAAFYTDDGEAFAIINYPETYKPAAADNAAAELGIKAVIDVINAQVVSEKIDPSMIYATKEWVSDQVDQSELSVLSHVGKNWTFDNGTSTTVNINADSTGMATLNVCSLDGVENEQTTGRVYVGQSLRHGGGIEYNGDNNPVTTGAGADHISFFRSDGSGLHWTARNYVHSNDWEFRGSVTSPSFIEGTTSLKDKYLGKSAKAADSVKLEGKTKTQVISEARAGLTHMDYQSSNFYDRSFSLTIPANRTVPFPDLPATACDILVFGSTDMTGTSTNFVGRFTRYGSTWSANTIYGSTNSTNYPSIAIVNNQPAFGNHHGIAAYPFEYKCWIACQSNANAKPFEFFANTYSTQNKPTPADISDKLARFESSLIDATGQDFRIRNKRALVGLDDRLVINYNSDWSHVDAGGTWRFTGNIERNYHNSGYLVGSYNNVGENSTKTNPIYTIGSNYQPSETELNIMHGIGYTHASSASFVPYEGGWGMYVAADGDARIFLDASHGRIHTTGDVYEAGTKLSDKYLGKTAKAVDAAKLEGKTKAQVVNEALTHLPLHSARDFTLGTLITTSIDYSVNTGNSWMLEITGNAYAGGLPVDLKAQGYIYNQTIIKISAVATGFKLSGLIAINVDGRLCFWFPRQAYWQGFDVRCISTQFAGRRYNTVLSITDSAKPSGTKEASIPIAYVYDSTQKPTSAEISDKLGVFDSSHIVATGQDLTIRDKRALVGHETELAINHASDWPVVRGYGTWSIEGDLKVKGDLKMSGSDSYIWTPNTENGYTGIYDAFNNKVALKYTNGQGFDYGADINITKNNPWLTLDSAGSGSDTNEQAAGMSLGENGRDGGASLHLSYTGDGRSYIGMGNLGSDNIADNWAMKMHHQNTWVQFRSQLWIGDENTRIEKGGGNSLKIKTNHGYVDIGSQNSGHCHYSTDRTSHWFNKNLHVEGEIYAGSSYDKRVYHEGHKPSASDVGAFQRHYGRTPTVVKDNFTTIAKIEGYGLSSSIALQLKGTSGSTVVNVNAFILVNHHQDIVIDSLCGGYTAIQLKVISNGNEKYLIQVKLLSGNPLYLHCDILSYTNDGVSIGNYDTADYTIEHTHTVKLFGRNLSSSGETGIQINGHDVAHVGNIAEQSERRNVISSGTLSAHSKNHLTTTATFTLPDVSNLEEGTAVVASKSIAAKPTIKTHGSQSGRSEHIAMMRGTTMLTDTSVLFDRHCTLTFILNSDKNWEMQ
ncbi:phage tail protein [Pseudoalteromonas sp. MMG005]|uniref:phage tail protein n=1 Tax=Pseudoalteromonas sp. MMG005 TaxID=2822682 RepID=UPI001B39EFE1|nr:phage tail protein [Pseudoalteromonas sp. MMG005]MBQ4844937.1 phage tail protein [Pseudoalteromonas sp. MMG005]